MTASPLFNSEKTAPRPPAFDGAGAAGTLSNLRGGGGGPGGGGGGGGGGPPAAGVLEELDSSTVFNASSSDIPFAFQVIP